MLFGAGLGFAVGFIPGFGNPIPFGAIGAGIVAATLGGGGTLNPPGFAGVKEEPPFCPTGRELSIPGGRFIEGPAGLFATGGVVPLLGAYPPPMGFCCGDGLPPNAGIPLAGFDPLEGFNPWGG